MRILIFASNIGKTAPGIVFERLLNGLSQMHQIDVVTEVLDSDYSFEKVNRIIEIKKKYLHPRIFKFLISCFKISPIDWFWTKKVLFKLKRKKMTQYDLIFSLISFHHYTPLIAGLNFSKKINAKWAVYSVDAIPAPLGWSKNNGYFRSVKKNIKKYLSEVDLFFSANQQMLDYQLKLFNPKSVIQTDVVYNPNNGALRGVEYLPNDSYMFLYTGGIYGVRTPKFILEAFLKFQKIYPNSTLEFVGSHIPEKYLVNFNNEEKAKVIVHPHTKNLESFYQRSLALIDIDGDIQNDVFLSSKIVNYLEINRIIISETGPNSPSRSIFKNIASILQCDHNSDSLYLAMVKVIELNMDFNFDDRNNVLKLFSLENNIETINNTILKCLK